MEALCDLHTYRTLQLQCKIVPKTPKNPRTNQFTGYIFRDPSISYFSTVKHHLYLFKEVHNTNIVTLCNIILKERIYKLFNIF